MSRRMVVFAPNWLGDTVMALPAIADFRRAHPASAIDVAARPAIAPLVGMIPDVDNAIVLGERRASIERLAAGGYEAALLLPNSFNAAWIARRARIPERWGYRNELRSMLLTRSFPQPSRVHQAASYQHLTTGLGCTPGPLEPRLVVAQDVRTRGEALLSERGWDGRTPLVAVAPGAAFGTAKRWRSDRFAAVIDALSRDGIRSVLIGAGADARAGRDVEASLSQEARPIDLIGATDLPTLAAVLQSCRALVTNDSGAMHMAAALGVSVTAVFGPTNEQETAPLGSGRLSVLHANVWCRPCMLRECPLTHACMTGVGAESVLTAVREAL